MDKLCPSCKNKLAAGKYCPECGVALVDDNTAVVDQAEERIAKRTAEIVLDTLRKEREELNGQTGKTQKTGILRD